MTQAYITVEKDARGVAVVTLNRPEVHNAFNDGMMAELRAAFADIAADDAVRLAVLRGAGRSFCAGADLAEMKAAKEAGEAENRAHAQRLAAMYTVINQLPMPLLGVVQGAALGGGTGLAAVCDFVLAGPRARFGLTEVRLGIIPAVISPYVMAKIGQSYARAYFLSGLRFDAEEALRMGLVHRVVAEDALEDVAQEMIDGFLHNSPAAMRMAKELVVSVPGFADDAARDAYTAGMIARARASEEGQEGLAAFLEKRTASWMEGA